MADPYICTSFNINYLNYIITLNFAIGPGRGNSHRTSSFNINSLSTGDKSDVNT